jgi:hypothetical protein
MSQPAFFDSPASSNALNHCRALHHYLYRQPGCANLGAEEESAKDLWVDLARACACPVEDTLVLALRKLDALREMIETSHVRRPLMDVSELRRHMDTIEGFIDEVPLAPASTKVPPCAAHDLPTSGLLFRLLQRRPLVPSVNAARPVAKHPTTNQTDVAGDVRVVTRAVTRKVRSARSAPASATRPHNQAA